MTQSSGDARARVLNAAEELFAEKGFGPVTLRQIGARAGIHHSSLYHHVPGGKADLFVEVMERNFTRHQHGLTAALAHSAPEIRQQLYAVADWFITQPPVDLVRMEQVDFAELHTEQRHRLIGTAYVALQGPVMAALEAAQRRGEIRNVDGELVAGGLVGMIQSLHAVSEEVAGKSRRTMAHGLIDVLLDGLYQRM